MNRDLSLIRVTRVQALAEAAKSAFPEAAEATGPV
jgi:hypothetical protein